MHHLRFGDTPDRHPHPCQALHLIGSLSGRHSTFSSINSLTTVAYLLEVFFRLWMASLDRIPLMLGASTGNLGQSFFDTFSVGS